MSVSRCECDAMVDTDYCTEGAYCPRCYWYICSGCLESMVDDGYLTEEEYERGESEVVCRRCVDKRRKAEEAEGVR